MNCLIIFATLENVYVFVQHNKMWAHVLFLLVATGCIVGRCLV